MADSNPVPHPQISRTDPRVVPASEDARLLDRCARGDEAGLGGLYQRYAGVLYGIATRITRDRADAEEIVVETFARAWREAGRFDPARGSVGAWLTMMTRSRALDLVRGQVRRVRITESARMADPGRPPAMGHWEDDPASDADRREQTRRVREALGALPADQRTAIELAYYEGLSHSEIAARLQEPLGTIKTRVRLAMQKLRDALHPFRIEAAP